MLQAGLTSAVEDGCSSAGFSKVSEFSVGLSSFEAGGVGKAVSVLEVAAVSSSGFEELCEEAIAFSVACVTCGSVETWLFETVDRGPSWIVLSRGEAMGLPASLDFLLEFLLELFPLFGADSSFPVPDFLLGVVLERLTLAEPFPRGASSEAVTGVGSGV